MKYNHPVNVLLSIFAVLLVGIGVLYSAGREMTFYKQSATQKSILKGVESISDAAVFTADTFSDIIKDESEEKYQSYKKLTENPDRSVLKESYLNMYYREGVVAGFLNRVGGEDDLAGYISRIMPKPSAGTLRLDDSVKPSLYIERNEDGMITSASVRNVVFVYDGIPGVKRTEKMRFNLLIPDAVFYGGDESLFDYSMIAGKGIYATGATSSFVGNIYAGPHSESESREIEVAYGEIGSYGGLNFLSTQVGVAADTIISESDINLNGSFVIFGPEGEDELVCYAGKIRKMRGYLKDSVYSMGGELCSRNEMTEERLTDYLDKKHMIESALSGIDEIPFYYDSNNDESYTGEYRKIISSENVEINEDITGIIFTPGTVIVGPGCNIEGLIMCGDRIYLQGDNNIVANQDIVKKIISAELAESAEGETDGMYHAFNYIGGFRVPGIKEQNINAIPYQE